MPSPETPGHSQASLGQSLVGTLLLSPGSWCTQGSFCAVQESVSPVSDITVTEFIFLGSKITADGDSCSKIKTRLLFRRKAMTNLDSILKSRDITLPTKVHLVKDMVFPLVMYDVRTGPSKKMSTEELMLFNCGAGEDLESLGQQGDQASQP